MMRLRTVEIPRRTASIESVNPHAESALTAAAISQRWLIAAFASPMLAGVATLLDA